MGAKTWMLVLAESDARKALSRMPELNRDATLVLANKLFPGEKLEQLGDGNLSFTCPPKDEIQVGCFPGISIIAAREFGLDYPSKLPQRFIAAGGNGLVTLHAMHSVVNWFAYALWADGQLIRSLSVSSDDGVLEDIGQHLPFEQPYWSGDYPDVDSEDDADAPPLPFHPLELGEATLRDQFGYQLEGAIDPNLLDAESIPLIRYKRSRSAWWRFW